MTAPVPELVSGWPLGERIDWILRQPVSRDVTAARLVALVRSEKEASIDLALSVHVCGGTE